MFPVSLPADRVLVKVIVLIEIGCNTDKKRDKTLLRYRRTFSLFPGGHANRRVCSIVQDCLQKTEGIIFMSLWCMQVRGVFDEPRGAAVQYW